ncbi:hypothetical protein EB838_26920 [Klebsiella pneumoniae]|nr:hypothetical protein EB838_26920 [Klebsiella pneumoniae]
MIITLKKCPDEPGETGMMESAVLGWVSQGLQHEVIAMASCCKKGGGQKGNNCHRQTCTGTTGITVLRRDWVVVPDSNRRGDPFGTHYPPMQQWQAWMEL